MKANELMVCDWVKPFGAYDGVYMKISSIAEDRAHGVTSGGNPDQNKFEKLYPISLTNEILEKNFGEKIDGEYFSGDEYYEIHIKEISDSIWKVDYDCLEMNGIPRQSNLVSYVHELQHALRLYGLFDSADCFSV